MKISGAHKAMKRVLIFLVTLGIIVPILFTAGQMGLFSPEPTVEIEAGITSESAPVLRIATDYDFCPNSYYNKDGELSGLYVEIMIEVANRLGMRPEFKTADWMGCRKMLTEDEVDVLTGLEIFSNMEGTLRTIPFCSDELRVYGRSRIDSAAALAGKKVALMARSVIATTYDLQCDYLEYSTNTEILEAVEQGEADFGICHGAVATKIIEKNHLHLVPSLVITKSYPALAVHDTQPKLQRMINEVVRDMSEDGTIGRLQNKWITEFARNRSLEYVFHQNEVFYITFILGIIIVLCITAGYWEVDRRQEKYIRTLLEYQEKLQQSNEETKRANQAKSEFFSKMSHDIRTPMNAIMGLAALAAHCDDKDHVDDYLKKIVTSGKHMLELLNEVLDMSKIESGKTELNSEAFLLKEKVEEALDIIKPAVEEKRHQLIVETEALKNITVLGDALRLQQILLNLLSNAVKYTPDEGVVKLTVTVKPLPHDLAVFDFIVEDNGIGMEQSFIERIFEPFIRAEDSRVSKIQGTGLGMTISLNLAKLMNGSIDVESCVGKGSKITASVCLKVQRQNGVAVEYEQPAGDNENAADIDYSGKRVLVVEDNAINLEIALEFLKLLGLTCESAGDGAEALEKFLAAPEGYYDLIFMDIQMPTMNGYEAARAIRAASRSDAVRIPIIAITANAFSEDVKMALAAGMNAHIAKPFELKLLKKIIRQWLK